MSIRFNLRSQSPCTAKAWKIQCLGRADGDAEDGGGEAPLDNDAQRHIIYLCIFDFISFDSRRLSIHWADIALRNPKSRKGMLSILTLYFSNQA